MTYEMMLEDIMSNPAHAGFVVVNLIIIESLLSVDNAAVLASMVMDLPQEQRPRALKYGIWGAYFFRGLALFFAAQIIKILWLKPLGGLYLLWLALSYFRGHDTKETDDDLTDKKSNFLYRNTVGLLGNFWATVTMVELMDMAFSIDNVFAAVAFSDNLLLVCLGVFIGIFAMRFIAQWFVKLMQRFPFMETSAFIVIALLGLKLFLSFFELLYPNSEFKNIMHSHTTDMLISILTVIIFFLPIITSYLIGWPQKLNKQK